MKEFYIIEAKKNEKGKCYYYYFDRTFLLNSNVEQIFKNGKDPSDFCFASSIDCPLTTKELLSYNPVKFEDDEWLIAEGILLPNHMKTSELNLYNKNNDKFVRDPDWD